MMMMYPHVLFHYYLILGGDVWGYDDLNVNETVERWYSEVEGLQRVAWMTNA